MLLTVPLALSYGSPFVVLTLAFCQRDLELGASLFPVKRQWHQRIALPLDRSGQISDLTPVQQQFSPPGGVVVVHVSVGIGADAAAAFDRAPGRG